MKHVTYTLLFLLTLVMLAVPAAAQDGKELYEMACASCHGDQLQGGNGHSLIDGVWRFGGKSSYIFRNVKHGLTYIGMPAFETMLTDGDIKAVVKYILEAEKESGIVKPPPPKQLQTLDYEIKVGQWAEGFEVPMSIDFLDADTALVTERPGRLRIVRDGRLQADAIAGTPEVLNEGQGGLMEAVADPEYAENGWIYLAYSHALKDVPNVPRPPAMTRIVRGRIRENKWTGQEVIFEAAHDAYRLTRHHYGCRIVFDAEGYLYFSIGERGEAMHAQDLSRPNGKIHRIHRDGGIPKDNPFVGRANALPSIFTYGNRNAQGLSVHPETGRVWESEHGPMGGDELNLLVAGGNYGWPVVTYGRNYDGAVVSEFTSKPGIEEPSLYWRPSIAVCGIDFYRGDEFPKWRNRLLVTALKDEEVQLLNIVGGRVLHSESILRSAGRVRDVASGPDGAIYVVLNSPGTILRLTRISERQY